MKAIHLNKYAAPLNGLHRPAVLAALLFMSAMSVLLGGCNGGSDDSGSETGMVILGLTDAEGDFLSYTVDVVSLTLTKANGAEMETLPLTTRVDFAQYTEMTEFLTAATIPTGHYTRAVLTLDYKHAVIQVDDGNDKSVPVSTILDEDGDPVSTLQVSVHLEGRNALMIRPGVPAHLTLDFDLQASNRVAFDDPANPVLTVEPVLLADLDPESPKIHRLRGPLQGVETAGGSFRVIIRPFWHVISGADAPFGTLTVDSDDDTVFDINGELLQGQAGIERLFEQTPLTAVIVIGDLNTALRRFQARQVFAGASVPGGDLDVVTGNVTKRTGDWLTVKGATLIRTDGSVVFHDTVDVRVAETTRVSRQLSTEQAAIGAISVGQRIRVFGELNGAHTEMDAGGGAVRMLMTTVKGTVVQTTVSLTVALTGIDNRGIDLFDFSGTGATPADDAEPDSYRFNTDNLSLSNLNPGDPVKIRGFVSPFGHPSEQDDFEARTLINVADVPAVLVVRWHPASGSAVTEIAIDGMALDLNGSQRFHHVFRAGVGIDLMGLAQRPAILPGGDGKGIYAIFEDGRRRVDLAFETFAKELGDHLNSGSAVRRVVAAGLFDDASATLTADWMSVRLE